MGIKEIVAKNIRKYRTKRGMTQAELADKCGVDVRYINRAENMPQNICLDHLQRLAEGLGVSIITLVSNYAYQQKDNNAVLEKLEEIKVLLK
jgi:transcriptional regulator with XRE-family HTH domain